MGKKKTRPNNRRARARRKLWYIWAASAGAMAVVAILVVVLLVNRRKASSEKQSPDTQQPTASATGQQQSPGSGEDSELPYPRIPGAVRKLPDWILADAPFDLKSAFPTIPPAENAAPLYLEAMVEVSSEPASCFPKDQQASLMSRGYERRREFDRIYADWSDGKTVHPSDIDRLLANCEPALEKLARAQQRPRCVFETGLGTSALLPHIQTAREFANLVELRNAHDLARGEVRRPIQAVSMLLRLTRDIQVRGFVITHLIGAAMEVKTAKLVLAILQGLSLTKDHADQLLGVLKQHEQASQPNPMAEAMLQEYVSMRISLNDLEHRTGDFAPKNLEKTLKSFGMAGSTPGAYLAAIGAFAGGLTSGGREFEETTRRRGEQIDAQLALMTPADFQRELQSANEYYRIELESFKRPFVEQAAGQTEATALRRKHLILSVMALDLPKLSTAVTRGQAARRCTMCLDALRRWQFDHASAPADLETVAKGAGLTAVPIDPFSAGQPLRMALLNGEPVIYSIGKDGHDDKALLNWHDGDQPGDFIFSLKDKSR